MKKIIILLLALIPIIGFSQKIEYMDTITLTNGGGTENIPLTNNNLNYLIYGSGDLSSSWTIQPSGVYLFGTEIYFQYRANMNLNGNTITIFGKELTDYEASADMIIKGVYDGSSWNTITTYEPGVYAKISNDTIFIGDDTALAAEQFWSKTATTIYPNNATDRVSIGKTSVAGQALDIVGSIKLQQTTTPTSGVIYKGSNRFIHNYYNSGSGFNTFVGELSGNLVLGVGAIQNTCMGYNTGAALTSGANNTLMGSVAGASITSGTANTAIGGGGCLDATTTGGYNTTIGAAAMTDNVTGGSNTAIGYRALRENISGKDNVAIGYTSGTVSTGDSNIFIGTSAGNTLVNGDNCILIGSNIQPDNVSADYQINIGSVLYTDSDLDLYFDSRNDTIRITDTLLVGRVVSNENITASGYMVSTGVNTIASAGTITLDGYNHYIVTGTIDIDSIDVASNIPTGTVVHLIFTGTAASNGVVDGANLKIEGNFAYSPNDVLTLIREEDVFYQISRSPN
jgi:hypothetical protein